MRILNIILGMIVVGFSACSTDDDGNLNTQPTPLTLETPDYFGAYNIPADNPMTVEGVELGRHLFYEKQLSQFDSISCGSCHLQSKAFTDGRERALGVPQQPLSVNTMTLTNALWEIRFSWNGRQTSLEEQAIDPLTNHLEMNQDIDVSIQKLENTTLYPELFRKAFGTEEITADRIAKALAQFERTLISADSKYDAYIRGEYQPTAQELRGIDLFFTHPVPEIGLRGGNCGDCHSSFLTSGFLQGLDGFHNNGLDNDANLRPGLESVTSDPLDRGKFKTPSLRNIALTAPYMHDGRFNSIEDVLDHYNEHIQDSETLDVLIREASNEPLDPDGSVLLHLTEQEKQDIISFLNMLTDENFINNEAFSDPFGN